MSDDLSNNFLQSREIDPDLEGDLSRLRDAGVQEKHRGFLDEAAEAVGAAGGKVLDANSFAGQFGTKLPKNITVGVMDAAKQTIDFTGDIEEAGDKAADKLMEGAKKPATLVVGNALNKVFDKTYDAALGHAWNNLRGELARGSTGSDELVQSAAQFFIPFTAYSRAIKAGTVAKAVLADAATMLTSFEPHEARFADLLRLANTDNSLVNAYIDYISAEPTPAQRRGQEETEGEWEGRFKNIVDSQVAGAAISGVILAGAKAFKSIRVKASELMEVASATNP